MSIEDYLANARKALSDELASGAARLQPYREAMERFSRLGRELFRDAESHGLKDDSTYLEGMAACFRLPIGSSGNQVVLTGEGFVLRDTPYQAELTDGDLDSLIRASDGLLFWPKGEDTWPMVVPEGRTVQDAIHAEEFVAKGLAERIAHFESQRRKS